MVIQSLKKWWEKRKNAAKSAGVKIRHEIKRKEEEDAALAVMNERSNATIVNLTLDNTRVEGIKDFALNRKNSEQSEF